MNLSPSNTSLYGLRVSCSLRTLLPFSLAANQHIGTMQIRFPVSNPTLAHLFREAFVKVDCTFYPGILTSSPPPLSQLFPFVPISDCKHLLCPLYRSTHTDRVIAIITNHNLAFQKIISPAIPHTGRTAHTRILIQPQPQSCQIYLLVMFNIASLHTDTHARNVDGGNDKRN